MKFIFRISFLLLSLNASAQSGTIKGIIKDSQTDETLVGATIMLQGTTRGVITDVDGNYVLGGIAPGSYNLIYSSFSSAKKVVRVKVEAGKTTVYDIRLDPIQTSLDDVVVLARKRTDTESSLLNSMKASPIVMTGISNQQIQKVQDRDASEVIRRVPGITIYDNRFVIVRGLSERYNSVWMNGGVVPSSETDSRAFSFDIIPSSMIDRLMVYKSPAPELPGDFAGGAIQVFTKNVPDKNSISFSYSASYRAGSTGETFYKTQGGKYDWLGIDDGSREMPSSFPKSLKPISDRQELADYGKQMSRNWTASPYKAQPDHRFSLGISRRFNLGESTLGSITSLSYSNTNTFRDAIVSNNSAEFDPATQIRKVSWKYNDKQYTNSVKIGLLHNWSWVWGNNQRIEFRNLINNIGNNKTTLRNGNDFANFQDQNIRAYQYSFMDRFTYSGQLGGNHQLTDGNDNIDWTYGYSYANRNEPDVRRFSYLLDNTDPGSPNYNQYFAFLSILPDPRLAGRLFLRTKEHIQNLAVNYDHKFYLNNFKPVFKCGIYGEKKTRSFNARLLGYQTSIMWPYTNNYQPMDSIFQDKNLTPNGLFLGESTNPSDSYTASNTLFAGYTSFMIPVTSNFSVYTGVRFEKNQMILNSYSSDFNVIPVKYDMNKIDLLPSVSLTYNVTQKQILRFVYGKTINRPEFREVAPFSFYEFERAASIRGNDSLKNASIHNFDLRYELYPSKSEIITFGFFYKRFINPIESYVTPVGSDVAYSFTNANFATSMGLELEIRKSFEELELFKLTSFLRNFGVVCNAALIKSRVHLDEKVSASNVLERPMQGQSPYIVNAGLFYQNDSIGLQINLQYNVIGKRIIFVGDDTEPDVYEMPRHLLDLTFTQNVGKYIKIKGGIQDILHQASVFNQTFDRNEDLNRDGIAETRKISTQNTLYYRLGTYYTLGIQVTF